MKCIFCQFANTEVIETRVSEDKAAIRRRRSCTNCKKRFTTYERVDELPVFVVKRDNRRERFDRKKLRDGLFKAVGKTTISASQVEGIVAYIEHEIARQGKSEVVSGEIGEMVAIQLKGLDKVAYIRFSSVFKRFVDVEEFEKELKKLV